MSKKKLLLISLITCVVGGLFSSAFTASPWDGTKEYKTAWKDTVTYGKFLNNDMFFVNKWWISPTDKDTPGTLVDSGGTSGWVYLNAVNPTVKYVWKGATVTPGSSAAACVPTFRDGAKGGYAIHHDDMCAMTWDYIDKTWEMVKKYSIPIAWGVKGDECEDGDWTDMQEMLMDGIEITSHSENHHSAAEQWQWFYQGDTLPDTAVDASIPGCIAGYIVDSTLASGTTVTSPQNQSFTINTSTKKLKTNSTGWNDDAAANVKMIKVFCYPAWTAADYALNVDTAKKHIDDKVYANFNGNKFFPKGKKCEFYIYPYDAFSVKTHEYLDTHGFISARGGSKSGKPLRGDFFHPFFIDFDAYYLVNNDPNVLFPDNPHQLLSLEGMVDSIIKCNGYMIRELHAVAPNASDYWGAVPTALYEAHFARLDADIKANNITVYSVSEAVKYRLTANSVTGVTVASQGNKQYLVTVAATGCLAKYQDEISAIVAFPTSEDDWEKIGVTYNTGSENPRFPPRKLSARVWSVSVNPYKGAVKVIGDITNIDNINSNVLPKAKVISFIGGKLTMSLRQGNYTASLLTPNGKIVGSVSGYSAGGTISTNMAVKNLSNGFYILSVKHSRGMLHERVVLAQ